MPRTEYLPDETDPTNGRAGGKQKKKNKDRNKLPESSRGEEKVKGKDKSGGQRRKPEREKELRTPPPAAIGALASKSAEVAASSSLPGTDRETVPTSTATGLPVQLCGKRLAKFLKDCQTHPLLWADSIETEDGFPGKWLYLSLHTGDSREKKKWTRSFAASVEEGRFRGLSQQNRNDAFVMLAGAWLLGPSVREQQESPEGTGTWQQQLVDELWGAADGFDELPHEDMLTWIWTQVELPTVLALCLSDSDVAGTRLLSAAARRLEEWFELSVDSEGSLPGRYASLLPSITMSVVRSVSLLKKAGIPLSPRAVQQLDWMIRQLMLVLDRDGSMLFCSQTLAADPGLVRALKRLSPDSSEHRLIEHLLGDRTAPDRKLPEPCHYSESQGFGVLRTGWGRNDCRVGIACDGADQWIEVTARGKPLFEGPLVGKWSLNGRPLTWEESTWTLNCWYEDSEVQYLELELKNEEGLKFQRHFVLLPEDHLLLVADALLGTASSRIDYRLNLPIAQGNGIQQETETREVILRDTDRVHSLILPITIGEWQRDHTVNAFSVMEDSLQLDQSGMGQNLFAAVAVDLNPKRSARPRTWRQLTVGEALGVVAPDSAVAQRFQVGKEQWVCYRSLSGVGNRTFMGCNVYCDFYIGRFNRKGKHETLVMIEA